MKQLLLALAGLAVLAGLLWFLFGRGVEPPAPSPGPLPSGAGVAAVDPEWTAPEDLQPRTSLPEGAQPEVGERAEVEAPPLEAAPGITFSEPDPEGLLFEVVVAASGAPLPRAHLIYMGSQAAMSAGAQELLAAGAGLDAVMERFGRHFRCDEAGQVRIGDLESEAIVRARGLVDGVEHAGLLEVDKNGTRVEVRPRQGFRVRVVDPAGVGLPDQGIALVASMGTPGNTIRFPMNAATTDSSGEAFVPNILLDVAEEDLGMMQQMDQILLSLAGFYELVPEVEVDWRTTTPAEVELVRPPSGRVEVLVLDAAGQPYTGGAVYMIPAGEPFEPGEQAPDRSQYRSTGLAEDGRVVFEAVQRGVAFDLRLVSSGVTDLGTRAGLVLGPDQELLEVELSAGASVPRLVGRALGPDGLPLVDTELLIGQERMWNSVVERLDTVTTDADGAFEVLAPWSDQDQLVLQLAEPGADPLSAALGGLGQPGPDGILRVGDVVLARPGVLLAGRIVDAAGQGVSAKVTVETAQDFGQSVRWKRWEGVSAADGSFELRGLAEVDVLYLHVLSPDHVSPGTISAPTGTRDLEVRLEAACYFVYQLPDEDPELISSLTLELVDAGVDVRSADRLRSPALPPGEHRYRFKLGYEDDMILSEGRVTLEAGEETDLGLIRFDRAVRHYRILITHPEELPASMLWIRAQRPGLAGFGGHEEHEGFSGTASFLADFGHSFRDRAGTWHLLTVEPAGLLRVHAGSFSQDYSLVEGDNHLTLDLSPSQAAELVEVDEYIRTQGYL